MKSFFLLSVLACFSFKIVYSQEIQNTSAKSVYAELGGPGLASINYDMRFGKRSDGLGFRAGFGGFSIDGISVLFVPVGLNYLIGRDNRNYLELGAAFTYVNFKESITSDNGNFTSSFGSLNLGYRLQPANGGFSFRVVITPVFGSGGFFPFYGGISFGYAFK